MTTINIFILQQDVCIACGLVASAAITFVIMFLPKGRQLSAMGRDGVYAEDRTDVYTGSSSTQSTGSAGSFDDHTFGDPSPSFFPIKPSNKLISQFKNEKDFLREATSRSTPNTPWQPRNHNHGASILKILTLFPVTRSTFWTIFKHTNAHGGISCS